MTLQDAINRLTAKPLLWLEFEAEVHRIEAALRQSRLAPEGWRKWSEIKKAEALKAAGRMAP